MFVQKLTPDAAIDPEAFVNIEELSSIVDIAAGYDHMIALDSEGRVFGLGDDTFGQCGCGDIT